ncbi:MAG: septation protein IspZ [Paracoccaceae bacterium]
MSDKEPKPVSGLLKQVLEFGPLIVFLGVYLWAKDTRFAMFGSEYDGFVFAVLAFIPVQLVATLAQWWLSGRISRIQVFTLALLLILGVATVVFNDERAFKMKSTFIFGAFGIILFIGLWRGKSWLAFVLDQALPISHEGWMILTRRMAWFFLAFAGMNELVWRNFSTDVYVFWDTFGQMGVMFAFLLGNYRLIDRYWTGPRD